MAASMTLQKKCNRCGAEEAIRSHRRTLEYLLLWLKPYRCAGCDRRFYHLCLHHEHG